MLSKTDKDLINILVNDNTENCIHEYNQSIIAGSKVSRQEYAHYLSGTVRGAFDIYCATKGRKAYSDQELVELQALIAEATAEFLHVLGVNRWRGSKKTD